MYGARFDDAIERRSFSLVDPREQLVADSSDQVQEVIGAASAASAAGHWVAGYVAYEAAPAFDDSLVVRAGTDGPLAWFGVFGGAVEELPLERDPMAAGAYSVSEWQPSIDQPRYKASFDEIRERIKAGDTYQVNLTFPLTAAFTGDPAGLYTDLLVAQAPAYAAHIFHDNTHLVSVSPERFFAVHNGRITTRPMKGTARRGRWLDEDIAAWERLVASEKDRAENLMIVDLLRNDLGRVAEFGSVVVDDLFTIEKYQTVWQMTSGISADLRPDVALCDVFAALFPCGSITGAPKASSMRIIADVEDAPRGVYCGAIGYSGPDASVFNVPIRTMVLEEGKGEMGIGSGIIFDSDPEAEWQETLLKGNFLTRHQPDFQLIETLLWQPGSGYWLIDEHLDRLADSAAYFLFGCDKEQVIAQLAAQARTFDSPMRVRLLLHRDGKLSVAATELDTNARPEIEPAAGSGPLPKVLFSKQRTDPESIHLFHKTTQRQLYIEERQQALDKGFVDVLFVNKSGEVTEGSISNIFITVIGDDTLLTPPVNCGLLGGTFRRFLLDQGRAVEKVLTREDLRHADAVYVGNSVRGLVQVAVEGE